MTYEPKTPKQLATPTETKVPVSVQIQVEFTSGIKIATVKFTNVNLEIVNEAIAHINDNGDVN